MFAARKLDLKSFLVGDKLIINGQSYTVDTLKDLHNSLDVPTLGTIKVTNILLLFMDPLDTVTFSPCTVSCE